jgi:hypothetical protein
MTNKFASTEARLTHLEKVCGLQQQIIDRLHVAILGHQYAVEALALVAGIELQQRPAPNAPLSTMN